MKIFICLICGHLEFGDAPDKCPVCGALKKDFKQNDNVFTESKEKSPEAEIKHVPDITVNNKCSLIPEENCTDILIRIGKKLHPSEEKHFIQFIDCYQDNKHVVRIHLTPDIYPAGCIHLKKDTGLITVVENCNIHGYWKTDITL